LINSYTTGLSPTILSNILELTINHKGYVSNGEVGLAMKDSNLILPCGIYGRWEKK
jgi:23S rRNA (cytosine1962-C5)-methyltransferase